MPSLQYEAHPMTRSNDPESPQSWAPATQAIRGGLMRSPYGETAEALYLTQSFVYDSAEAANARFAGDDPGYVYSRYANPTVRMFEERLALMEGAESCRTAASGMAAIFTALTGLVRAGDHVLASRALFGSCRWLLTEYLPRFGVETTVVDGPDLKQWEAGFRPNTKAVLIESPANPLLEIVDVKAICDLAHAAGAKVIVDNVFATPVFQKPLTLGADIVVYSATKHIDGQGRVLGGAILGATQLLEDSYRDILRHTGPALSPFNAWVLLKGLETMELRVRRQSDTAAALADLIADSGKAVKTLYPLRKDHPQYELARRQMSGGSNLVAFDFGAQDKAFRFLNALQIVDISNNLGDSKSMAVHPPTTTHRAMSEEARLEIGLTEGWVRLSVGLEDLTDLSRDISRALDVV
jgi:O-succinylhomoserine sulfhydrylase